MEEEGLLTICVFVLLLALATVFLRQQNIVRRVRLAYFTPTLSVSLDRDVVLCILRVASQTDPRIREVSRLVRDDCVVTENWYNLRSRYYLNKIRNTIFYRYDDTHELLQRISGEQYPNMFSFRCLVNNRDNSFVLEGGMSPQVRLIVCTRLEVKKAPQPLVWDRIDQSLFMNGGDIRLYWIHIRDLRRFYHFPFLEQAAGR